MVVAGDFQLPFVDRKLLHLFYKFLRYFKPDTFVINGDFVDCTDISDFSKNPKIRRPIHEEFAMAREILAEFRKILPKAEIWLLEGNHEFRMQKYLQTRAPEITQLKGMTIPEQLDLDKFNIKWVGTAEEASRWNGVHKQFGQLYIGHFNKVSAHSAQTAKALVDKYGVSILQNHTHRSGIYHKRLLDGRQIVGVENFCMCQLKLPYDANPNWQSGWSVVYFKEGGSGRFHIYPIHVLGYKFIFGGREFRLED